MRTLLLPALILLASLPAWAGARLAEPLTRGRGLEGWTFYRDATRLAEEYTNNELTCSGEVYDWAFVPRTVQYADVFLERGIPSSPERIEVEVRNLGEPLDFVLRALEALGPEYISPRVRLEGSGKWQTVSAPIADFRLGFWSQDKNNRLDFPLRAVSLTVYEVQPGHQYRLQFRNLRLVREVGLGARLISGRLPATLTPGKQAAISFTLAGEGLAGQEAALELIQDGVTRYRQRLGEIPAGLACSFPRFTASRFWQPGRYQAAICAGGSIAALQEVTVKANPAPPPQPPTCRVQPYHGAPTLFINGRPSSAMVYMTYRPLAKHFATFGEAGVHLYSFSSTPTQAGYGLAPACWTGPDTYDYSQIDRQAAEILDSDPEARFFPRLYLLSPQWWDERHPDDLVTYDPGDGKPVPFWHAAGKRAPSWASEAWRQDTAQALRRYLRHVQASPYADRVIGYHLASGTTEEWMQWGSNENQWVDYSPANLAKFRGWLREKYGSDAALQQAWGDPRVTLATATIPTQAQRAASEVGILRDPQRAMPCIDYVRYNSWLVADTIAYLARVVKEETARRALVGVFYGYVLQLAGEQREQNAGHLALQQVWSLPDVDFITSPSSYMFRQLGTGYSHFMSLTDGVKLHGKMWFDENDIRTWLTLEGNIGDAGKTATYEETRLHQQRELGNVLANACGMWWFDMSGGWYDDPRIMADISTLKRAADAALACDRTPVAEVAVVVDDASSAYLQPGNRLSHHLLVRQLPELGRMGAPFALLHPADLEQAPDYRMYVFLNLVAPTPQERRLIRKKVCRAGKVAVWVWAPGLIRDERICEQAMADLTGLDLALDSQPGTFRVTVGGPEAWVGEAAGMQYGLDASFAPLVWVRDAAATALGTLADGRCGLAAKDCGGWTSVYSSAPELPAALLRALAQRAGVHLYAPLGDVVYASRGLLAVSVNEAGRRTIRLPRPADVYDLYENREVGRNLTSFTADLPAAGTRLYRLQ